MSDKHFENTIWGSLEYEKIKKTKVFFHTNGRLISIKLEDVVCFEYLERSKEYQNRTTILHTYNDKIPIKSSIASIYEELPATIFSMPHRSFIVNLINVKSLVGDAIILDNGIVVPVSQKRISEFRNKFKKFIEQNEIFLK